MGTFEFEHLLLDLNGTTSRWGRIDDGVAERLRSTSPQLTVHLLSADTYGTLAETAESLGLSWRVVANGEDKRAAIVELGAERSIAIGNGVNDAAMLAAARVGIAVLGGEGLSAAALRDADVLCGSMTEALDLLLHDSGLAATLRP
jgi:P-type E1-E2 ATPase